MTPDSPSFNLYVANQGSYTTETPTPGTVYEVSPQDSSTPSVTTFASALACPFGLAFDNKNLYVANFGNGLNEEALYINKIGLKDRRVETFGAKLGAQYSLAFDREGALFVCVASGQVYKVTDRQSTLTYDLAKHGPYADPNPCALDFLSNGDLIVVAHGDSKQDGYIARLTLAENSCEILQISVQSPTDLVVVPNENGGDDVYVSQQGTKGILKLIFDAKGSLSGQSDFVGKVAGYTGVDSICLGPDGNFYVITDFCRLVYSVPYDGNPTRIRKVSEYMFDSARRIRCRIG